MISILSKIRDLHSAEKLCKPNPNVRYADVLDRINHSSIRALKVGYFMKQFKPQ